MKKMIVNRIRVKLAMMPLRKRGKYERLEMNRNLVHIKGRIWPFSGA